jgi:hypothetical protein
MDVTEHSAAETIQNLEFTVSTLRLRLDQVGDILRSFDLEPQERIDTALDLVEKED